MKVGKEITVFRSASSILVQAAADVRPLKLMINCDGSLVRLPPPSTRVRLSFDMFRYFAASADG